MQIWKINHLNRWQSLVHIYILLFILIFSIKLIFKCILDGVINLLSTKFITLLHACIFNLLVSKKSLGPNNNKYFGPLVTTYAQNEDSSEKKVLSNPITIFMFALPNQPFFNMRYRKERSHHIVSIFHAIYN